MKSGKTRLVGCPLLSRLRRRFAPLRGTQRRYAALFFAPPGRYAPCALRAQPFWKHEKNADIYLIQCTCCAEKVEGPNPPEQCVFDRARHEHP